MAKVERQVECRSGEVALHRLWAARRPLLFQEDPSSEGREDRVGVGEWGGNRAGRREAESWMAQPGHSRATREGEFLPSQGMSHWQRHHACRQEW